MMPREGGRPLRRFCPIHQFISVQQVRKLRKAHPSTEVLAHLEYKADVLDVADVIGFNERMATHCRSSPAEEFIVLTEASMRHRLERKCPGKRFHFPKYTL